MVREFEDVPGDSLLLVVDPVLPAIPAQEERFEEAISLAATLRARVVPRRSGETCPGRCRAWTAAARRHRRAGIRAKGPSNT